MRSSVLWPRMASITRWSLPFEAMIEAKHAGHLEDWPSQIPSLREFGPGTLTVEDKREVCSYEMGRNAEANPWDAWDLDSPISRPVALQS